jgi:hypothetical protein
MSWLALGLAALLQVAAPDAAADPRIAEDLATLRSHARAGEAAPSEEARHQAVLRLLAAWREDRIPDPQQDQVAVRLRAQLGPREIPAALDLIEDPAAPRFQEMVGLLLSWGADGPDPQLLAYVLDESHRRDSRARLAEAMLLSEGHPMLLALLPTIHAGAEELYLSRVFASWRQCVEPRDFAVLEELAASLEGIPAQYALQLWALNETDEAARMRIYARALEAPANFRQVALDALATRGPHAGITDALRVQLDGVDPEMHALARRLLPRFGGPEALWQEYQQRMTDAPATQRSAWMRDLALSPLEPAKAEAARWLAEGGWRGSQGMLVSRILVGSPVLDPMLPTLLGDDAVPDRIRYSLALERADRSEAARDFLRAALEGRDRLRRSQAARALASAGQEQDLFKLAALAQDPATDDRLRALIVGSLAGLPEATPLVAKWKAEPPGGYETAVELLTTLILSPDPSHQAWARGFALDPPARFDEDERRGLRIEMWQQLGARAWAADVPFLEEHLERELRAVAALGLPEEQTWPHLTLALRDTPELDAITRAYRACLADVSVDQEVAVGLRAWTPEGVAPLILTSGAARVATVAPKLAWHWLDAAEAATALRASLAHREPEESAALAVLLGQPALLEAAPRLLAQGFPMAGQGWVLWRDRLEDRALVAAVRAGDTPLTELARLAGGWCEAALLAQAVELAQAGGAAHAALAMRLARHGVLQEPLSPEARLRLGQVAAAAGETALAEAQWRTVLRLAAPGTPLHKQATTALNQ